MPRLVAVTRVFYFVFGEADNKTVFVAVLSYPLSFGCVYVALIERGNVNGKSCLMLGSSCGGAYEVRSFFAVKVFPVVIGLNLILILLRVK